MLSRPDGSEDEWVVVNVPVAELGNYSVEDLGEGVEVQPVRSADDESTVELLLEGTLAAKLDGGCTAHMDFSWPRRYWLAPLGVEQYAELVAHAAQARERLRGDLHDVDLDIGDEIHVMLRFSIDLTEARLDRAFAEASAIQRELLEGAESVLAGIGDAVIAARKRLDGWGEQPLDELVDAMRDGTAYEKGLRLEELTSRLFRQVPGFVATGRVNTATEEIDIQIQNGSDDPLWRQETFMLIAECKNWSTRCGRSEFSVFKDKINGRVGRVRCGFLVSWNGFADTIEKQMLRGSEGDTLIVPVTGHDLREAVRNDDFAERLKTLHTNAVFL